MEERQRAERGGKERPNKMQMPFRRNWSRGTALMYAIGVWTVIGAFMCPRILFQKDEEPPPAGLKETILKLAPDKEKKIILQKSADDTFSILTTITYKPDFVPYTTRLSNYIQSLFGGTDKKEK